MITRIRVLAVAAAMLAAPGPVSAVHAQSATQPDDATIAAIANWRATTLTIVSPQFHDIIAATYSGQQPDVDANVFDEAMIAKAHAEQAALSQLDAQTVALIRNFYEVAKSDSGPDGIDVSS